MPEDGSTFISMDWENQYCENGMSLNTMFRFNAIPIKYCEILHRNRKISFKNPCVSTEDPEQPKQS